MIDDMVELKSFPMPPSDNALKVPLIIGGKTRTVKSADYRAFEREAEAWALNNKEGLRKAQALCLRASTGWALKVDRVYWFQRSTIIRKTSDKKTGAKAGDPKANDTFNRIKALHDVFSRLLGCDDKWFWCGNTEKKILRHIAFPECVDIALSLVDIEAE